MMTYLVALSHVFGSMAMYCGAIQACLEAIPACFTPPHHFRHNLNIFEYQHATCGQRFNIFHNNLIITDHHTHVFGHCNNMFKHHPKVCCRYFNMSGHRPNMVED